MANITRYDPFNDLVDDFFSREWVRLFCGADVADNLADRLTNYDFDKLRNELSRLYRSVFKTQDTGVANYGFDSTGSAATDFIVLDGARPQLRGTRFSARTCPASPLD